MPEEANGDGRWKSDLLFGGQRPKEARWSGGLFFVRTCFAEIGPKRLGVAAKTKSRRKEKRTDPTA